jgi:mycothiol synthase
VADLPAMPEGLTTRPLHADDVAPVAALLAASEQVDDTGEYPDADDLAEWWSGWSADLAQDGVAVCDPAGLVVGYATALASPTFRESFDVFLEGRVRPDHRGRGVGRALLDWLLERGAAVHAERHPEAPGRLKVGVAEAMTSLEAMVRRAGLTAERWYRTMERPLTDLPEAKEVPGLQLVRFTQDRDDEVRRAHNASFTEHHGSSERDPATWRSLFTGQRAFRPDLSVLALDDGVVVGYALAYIYEADAKATGKRQLHLGQIGVLPSARGRGVATAVIAASLQAGVENDCVAAGLDVDSGNVTGAVRLYERLGFTTARTSVSWELALPPVGIGAPR